MPGERLHNTRSDEQDHMHKGAAAEAESSEVVLMKKMMANAMTAAVRKTKHAAQDHSAA